MILRNNGVAIFIFCCVTLPHMSICTGVLREEWGFDGVVMSDWTATEQCSHAEAINAGNDLIMPGNQGVEKALRKALAEGVLNRDALHTSAGRILEMIFASDTCQGF